MSNNQDGNKDIDLVGAMVEITDVSVRVDIIGSPLGDITEIRIVRKNREDVVEYKFENLYRINNVWLTRDQFEIVERDSF